MLFKEAKLIIGRSGEPVKKQLAAAIIIFLVENERKIFGGDEKIGLRPRGHWFARLTRLKGNKAEFSFF